ncbi:IS1 transposase [Piscirickettsia salmonis]|nr:transposase [Piscirickettsia salmonis]QGP22556.1 IS1 transposase [Piscirickettsia salmonis]QGP25941.1 IS1 transposase [Piscirickettsia salmonis]QGP29329.1 IS1 transposase [Piscirickettsia salmonis]QGP32703.1 IS1 transposase [Piscirickettsia salmonis]
MECADSRHVTLCDADSRGFIVVAFCSAILPEDSHFIGKKNTQAIERKHLTLRTRIKRLARKTICFSKSEKMHDVVIGLFINKFEFGKAI